MKISEALKIVNSVDLAARPYEVSLVAGFTPLHLQTFLAANLQRALPDRRVKVTTGLFGDMAGELEKATKSNTLNIVAVLEWADIDARLGHRAATSWDTKTLSDIQATAPVTFGRLRRAVDSLQQGAPVVLCPPTLPFPPLFRNAGWQADRLELFLLHLLGEFNLAIAQSGVRVVSSSRLLEESPAFQRHDLKSDLYTGFPYALAHADAIAASLCCLLVPPRAKKGLITDLDDTLWCGTVGEVGPEGIHWDLDRHSHIHSLYQSLLASLADSGVLVGAASKNDAQIVNQAFEREDLLLDKGRIFPMEIHWQSKALSVSRILRAWNVSADSVVFVDDNASELAEVAEAHAGIECVLFPTHDHAAASSTLRRIRDLFGTLTSTSEDAIRLDSIRQSGRFQEQASLVHPEDFLRDLKASVGIEYDLEADKGRALELVNKTNQFNLNGVRYTESDWHTALSRRGATLMTASYQDRFGKLGTISAIIGQLENGFFRITVWVMSCRAFGRRIEYLCLRECFERHACPIIFEFKATLRNGPFQEFLCSMMGQHPGPGLLALSREQFDKICPSLYQTVRAGGKGTTIHGRFAEPTQQLL